MVKRMNTDRIESFQVDHTRLLPGVYVSRVDHPDGTTITTYDLRMKGPNVDPPLTTGAIHSIEHLGATFLRKHTDAPVIYFGPMGCRTGLYLILASEPDVLSALALVEEMMTFIADADTVPGATEAECGNASDHDLVGAKAEAKRYLEVLGEIESEADERLHYPK